MFPATVRCGNRARLWNTIPTSRMCAGRSVMSSPSRKTLPSVGRSRPAIMRSIVVLPHPEGPRNEISSPAGSSRSTPSTAATSANRLTSPSSRSPPRACASGPSRSRIPFPPLGPPRRLTLNAVAGALRDDQLRPVLVDPVLPPVVDLVLRTQGRFGTGTRHDLVLVVGHRERFPLRRRDRAEREREFLLDLRLTHPVDELHARADALGRLRDRPEAGVEDRTLGREGAPERSAASRLRRREHRDVVIELAERDLAFVVLRLCLRLVPEPQLHVRLDLGQLVHDLEDPVLGLEDLVAVEERRGGDLQEERVGRVLEESQLVLPLRVP